MNRKQYEEDLKRKQEEHLNNIYNNNNIWRSCLHDSCPDCIGTGIKKDGTPCVHGISCPCPKCTLSY